MLVSAKPYLNRRDISGCGLSGIVSREGRRLSGDMVKQSICVLNDRGNGLGAGFAAYGIYPDFKDYYCFHIMYDTEQGLVDVDEFIDRHMIEEKKEHIPTSRVPGISGSPTFYRYFVQPRQEIMDPEFAHLDEEDYIVKCVMTINSKIDGAYVFSSGKNMGAFKGVGMPADIADFFRIQEYEGYIWTAHTRFPTNTPGWWGGAHPFTLLDWSIVHNGEISSYGINKRYLETFGYHMTLLTDTEVVAYLLDLLIRKHGLDLETACMVLASPFWKDIDEMPEPRKEFVKTLRMTYGSGLLNGPFAIIFAFSKGLVGLNDRIKLRPLVAGEKDDLIMVSSEEAGLRQICPDLDRVWTPKAGEPVIGLLNDDVLN